MATCHSLSHPVEPNSTLSYFLMNIITLLPWQLDIYKCIHVYKSMCLWLSSWKHRAVSGPWHHHSWTYTWNNRSCLLYIYTYIPPVCIIVYICICIYIYMDDVFSAFYIGLLFTPTASAEWIFYLAARGRTKLFSKSAAPGQMISNNILRLWLLLCIRVTIALR